MHRDQIPVPSSSEDELDQLARAIAASLRLNEERRSFEEPTEEGTASAAGDAPEGSGGDDAGADAAGEEPDSEPSSQPWEPKPVHLSAAWSWDPEDRFYAVWSLSKAAGSRKWAGIHFGRGRLAYDGVIALNRGSIGGLQWHRCKSYELALDEWKLSAPHFKLFGEPRLLQWSNWDRPT